MVNTVGHRTTEMALQLGLLYSPAEALKIGLVDQLVREDQVLTTATETMTKWLAIPGMLNISYTCHFFHLWCCNLVCTICSCVCQVIAAKKIHLSQDF